MSRSRIDFRGMWEATYTKKCKQSLPVIRGKCPRSRRILKDQLSAFVCYWPIWVI